MLDIKLIREKARGIKKNLKLRFDGSNKLIDSLLEKDEVWRKIKQQADNLRAERNKISLKINEAKKKSWGVKEFIKQAKQIPNKILRLGEEEKQLQDEIKTLLLKIPNLLDKSVPPGEDESKNRVIHKFGETKKGKVPGYGILETLDLADIERAAKVAGSRFFYLKGDLVRLEYALMCFALDILKKRGFTLIEPPYMINRKAYEGAVILQDFEDVIYKIEDEDLYLIATSEHALASMHMNEILNLKKPLRYAGISTCFRKEAGTHGKDTRGIFRVHQFNKVEQFVFCKQEDSWKIHEELLINMEEIFKKLKLPYRIILLCSGDTGGVSAKTYDLELWFPSQNKYREVGSCSNCLDYQARRLNIKYEDKPGNMKTRRFCHTLNSTAIATVRPLIAILENNLQKDGSIKIPSVLIPYMNGQKRIEAVKK